MFDGFEEFDISNAGAPVHGCRGGDGPPVLLLHGIPETHLMWHRVAPQLAERYTVVATDLRGYGASGKGYGSSGPMTVAATRCQPVTSFQKRRPRRPHASC
jgi:pimeloyl-ACP methyl ester carboxylesterase